MTKHLFIALASLALSSAGYAQDPTSAKVRVRVLNGDGQPIWGANYAWRPLGAPKWSASSKTDSTGAFDISASAGPVWISVHAFGMFHASDTITVYSGAQIEHRVVLRRRPDGGVGFHIAGPARVSWATGMTLPVFLPGPQRPNNRQQFLFALIEPGYSAGRLSLGYASIATFTGSGWAPRATFLRKWKGTSQNLVGGEIMMSPGLMMGPRVGLFRRISGGTGWFLTADFSLGL